MISPVNRNCAILRDSVSASPRINVCLYPPSLQRRHRQQNLRSRRRRSTSTWRRRRRRKQLLPSRISSDVSRRKRSRVTGQYERKWKKKNKKTRKKRKQLSDVQKYNKWLRLGAGEGIQIVQDLLSYYAKCHEMPFCMRVWLISRRQEGGKGREKGWRFGIYNLAWWTPVTSHHQINLCKCPHVSPACPPTLPHKPQIPFLLSSRSDATRAPHTSKQKLSLQIDKTPCLCWLAEQAHTLQCRRNRKAQKGREAHAAVSRLFSFGLPAFFHSLSLSLHGGK